MKPFSHFRLFHWVFVLVFLAVYFSGDDGDLLHIWLGYSLVALVAVRLVIALIRIKGFPALWPILRLGAVSTTVSRMLVLALLLFANATLTTGLLMPMTTKRSDLATKTGCSPANSKSCMRSPLIPRWFLQPSISDSCWRSAAGSPST